MLSTIKLEEMMQAIIKMSYNYTVINIYHIYLLIGRTFFNQKIGKNQGCDLSTLEKIMNIWG